MNRHLLTIAIFSLAAISIPARSQTVKPGLWELQNSMSSPDSAMARQLDEMRKQLANMSPEQRKMINEMMAKQGGGAMPTAGGNGMAIQMCMSPEMVQRNELPVQQSTNCTHQRSKQSGTSYAMSYTCTEPPSSGQGTVQLQGDTAYTMDMSMTSTIEGKRQTVSIHTDGKWLGADCGAVKPPAAPARKK